MLENFPGELASILLFVLMCGIGIKFHFWNMKQGPKRKEKARQKELLREKIKRDLDWEKTQRNSRIEYI